MYRRAGAIHTNEKIYTSPMTFLFIQASLYDWENNDNQALNYIKPHITLYLLPVN